MEQQPSPKKMVIDGPVVSSSNNTAITVGETGANVGKPEAETSSAQMQTDDDEVEDKDDENNNRQGRKDSSRYGSRTPAHLKQVWKDDLNSGQVVRSLFEVFGEGIMSFIPAPEMSLFL